MSRLYKQIASLHRALHDFPTVKAHLHDQSGILHVELVLKRIRLERIPIERLEAALEHRPIG